MLALNFKTAEPTFKGVIPQDEDEEEEEEAEQHSRLKHRLTQQ